MQILHRICHIADVLLSLQQVGNVKYIGWSMQVHCFHKPDMIVANLQGQLEEMVAELDSWNFNVKCMRNDYYELNYYTTTQLLMLRQSLVKLKNNDSISLDPDILALLQSINPKIETQLVMSAIAETIQNVSQQDVQSEISLEVDMGAESQVFPGQASGLVSPNLIMNKPSLPQLTEDDLSNTQKMIMEFVVEQLDCKKLLVLKVFEDHTSGKKDKYDYIDLCSQLMLDEGNRSEEESDASINESESEVSDRDDDGDDDLINDIGKQLVYHDCERLEPLHED